MSLKSGIRDQGSGKNLFRIPDPGVKKGPDPGSATLAATFPERFQCRRIKKKRLKNSFPQNRLSCVPAKINQQEGTGAGIVSKLCAGRRYHERALFTMVNESLTNV
jgi:hypothetical protein